MTHLSSFEVVQYRGIDGLSLPRLSHANLVTGRKRGRQDGRCWRPSGSSLGDTVQPSCRWSEHVQRAGDKVLDPIDELANGLLELRGVENGSTHELQTCFEYASDMGRPIAVGGTAQREIDPAFGGWPHRYVP